MHPHSILLLSILAWHVRTTIFDIKLAEELGLFFDDERLSSRPNDLASSTPQWHSCQPSAHRPAAPGEHMVNECQRSCLRANAEPFRIQRLTRCNGRADVFGGII
ncbi:hypothetical protein BDR05DRAFT_967886 [Suillus weaverae]|nr:hypothetical protein BDR05DRAFT_967886 [Suillus weaverae]